MGLFNIPKDQLPSPLEKLENAAEKEEKHKHEIIDALIKKYHTLNNCLGYHIPELYEIAEELGNSQRVVEYTLDTLKLNTYAEFMVFLDKEHLAGVYWLAAYNTGERRTMEKVAKAFKTSTAELRKGMRKAALQDKD